MSSIKDQMQEIAASLWAKPCTFDELMTREFLKNYAEYGVWQLIHSAKKRGWIYEKGDVFYTYKKTVKEVLNPAGYELDLKEKFETPFEKSFRKAQDL